MLAGLPSNPEDYVCAPRGKIAIYYPRDGIYSGDELVIDFIDQGHGKQLTVRGLVTVPQITSYYADKIKNKSRYLRRETPTQTQA